MDNLKQIEEFLPGGNTAAPNGDMPLVQPTTELKPSMALTNLKKIASQAQELITMINQSNKLERWAEDHICTSADDIEEVYNYFKFGE